MYFITIGLAGGTLVTMAVILTYILGWANKAFHVEVDTKVIAINDILPGANCGGCDYVGCGEYAEAIVADNAPIGKCTVGGANCAAFIAEIMGVEAADMVPLRPVIHCNGHYADKLGINEYRGEKTCTAMGRVANVQACVYGCLGFGDCAGVCKYDAINIINNLATIDYQKCIGCGACAKACPRNIITMTPFKTEKIFAVACSNKDKGKEVMSVCKVGCITCKACTRHCSLFSINNNLSTINYDEYNLDFMDDLTKAADKCPKKVIVCQGNLTKKN